MKVSDQIPVRWEESTLSGGTEDQVNLGQGFSDFPN